jgi:hypothetical protein
MARTRCAVALPILVVGSFASTLPFSATVRAAESNFLTGQWQWAATCTRGSFHGVMEFIQRGDTFTGRFLETNFWDKGTISNGILHGNMISFDRTYGLIEQHLSARLSDSNRSLSGPYDSPMFGQCTLSGHKIADTVQ